MEFQFDESEMLWSLVGFVVGLAITLLAAYYLNKILKRSFGSVILSQPRFITTLAITRRLMVLCVVIVGVMATTFSVFPGSLGIISSIFVAALRISSWWPGCPVQPLQCQ